MKRSIALDAAVIIYSSRYRLPLGIRLCKKGPLRVISANIKDVDKMVAISNWENTGNSGKIP